MSNIDRHSECHMRTALGNCDPIGGFCTSVNESICEALHRVSRPRGEWTDIYQLSTKGHITARCKNCKHKIIFQNKTPNFCPNCGAHMKGIYNE